MREAAFKTKRIGDQMQGGILGKEIETLQEHCLVLNFVWIEFWNGMAVVVGSDVGCE